MDLVLLEEIFNRCRALSAEEREQVLSRDCAGDRELSDFLRQMLAEAQKPEDQGLAPIVVLSSIEQATPSSETESSGSSLQPGDILSGRYRVEEFLAEGGMGQVFRVRDLELDVPLALKTIHPRIASRPHSLRRFKQEVLLARSVTHGNVCRIFDLGHDDQTDVWFLTMEFLEGRTLADRIDTDGSLDEPVSLPIVRQMGDALDAAHRAGIVHRDFKSPNVMLVDEECGTRAVITDFGLAMSSGGGQGWAATTAPVFEPAAGSSAELSAELPADLSAGPGFAPDSDAEAASAATPTVAETVGPTADVSGFPDGSTPRSRTGSIVGTPAYMAPEQVAGLRLNSATDLYALGVVLFEMRTGRLPFRGDTPLDTARAHLDQVPPNPGALTEMSPDWERTILRLLAKDAKDRFATAHEAVLALEGRPSGGHRILHSLPAERDAFVGRESELELLAERLEPDASRGRSTAGYVGGADEGTNEDTNEDRILTLLGAGGTGKTRLAQKYGWNSLLRWPGGVWFCDLSETRSAAGVAAAVASSLGLTLGRDDPIERVGDAIAGRGRCLILLDNFEHVASYAEATLGRWTTMTTEARFIVTSRQRLRLSGEAALELEPLDPATRGIELFEARAWSHRPGFLVEPANQDQVRRIVETLDGLPLAIELAASRLRGLSAEELQAGLADRFQVLAGGKRGRHETLRVAMDWSWDLLKSWEQATVAQLSVFEGGFGLEPAEEVVALAEHPDAPPIVDILQSLVDQSWLRARAALGAPRFDMFNTTKDYAAEKLDPSSVIPAQRRHGAYFATRGDNNWLRGVNRPGGQERLESLELDLENLEAACRRAHDRGDEETVVAAYCAVEVVRQYRGPFAAAIELGRKVLGPLREPALRSRVLRALSIVERTHGDVVESKQHVEEALQLFRQMGDRRSEAGALGNLANVLSDLGEVDRSFQVLESALLLSREIGDRLTEASVLGNQGVIFFRRGDMERAFDSLETALAIHREIGNRPGEGVLVATLGSLYEAVGRYEDASDRLESALAIHRELGNRDSEGMALSNLSTVQRNRGQMVESRQNLQAALAIHREVGNRRSEGVALGNMARLDQEEGKFQDAVANYNAALFIHELNGNRRFQGIFLGELGGLQLDMGRITDARESLDKALEIHRALQTRVHEANVIRMLAEVAWAEDKIDEAAELFQESYNMLHEAGDEMTSGFVLSNLGDVELRRGDHEAAWELYDSSLRTLREVGARRHIAIVLAKVGTFHRELGEFDQAWECFRDSLDTLRDLSDDLGIADTLVETGQLHLQRSDKAAARAASEESAAIAKRMSLGPGATLSRKIQRLVEALKTDPSD